MLKYAKKEKIDSANSDANLARKKFNQICDHLEKQFSSFGKKCPSSEVILLQECLQQCLAVIVKPKLLFP